MSRCQTRMCDASFSFRRKWVISPTWRTIIILVPIATSWKWNLQNVGRRNVTSRRHLFLISIPVILMTTESKHNGEAGADLITVMKRFRPRWSGRGRAARGPIRSTVMTTQLTINCDNCVSVYNLFRLDTQNSCSCHVFDTWLAYLRSFISVGAFYKCLRLW